MSVHRHYFLKGPTHSNMIFPGPGIGGYCLPKDGGLGVWSYQTLMGFEDDIFKITPLTPDLAEGKGPAFPANRTRVNNRELSPL